MQRTEKATLVAQVARQFRDGVPEESKQRRERHRREALALLVIFPLKRQRTVEMTPFLMQPLGQKSIAKHSATRTVLLHTPSLTQGLGWGMPVVACGR